MTDQDKLFVYFHCGFKSLLIGEYTIDLSGSNQSAHGFFDSHSNRSATYDWCPQLFKDMASKGMEGEKNFTQLNSK